MAKTCHERAFEASADFTVGLLREIPELESITIVLSWSLQQERIPPGIMIGRNGKLEHPAELMRMGIQLHRAMQGHLDQLRAVLGLMDGQAAELAQAITARQQELDDLEQHLGNVRLSVPPATD